MKKLITQHTVEWAHCDAVGIVFYPHFYIWFDQCTERLFKANDLPYPHMEQVFGVKGIPLLETGAQYKNACELGDELTMQTWIEEWDRKTFLVKHRLEHSDGQLALEGFERRVVVTHDQTSPKGMKAMIIPQVIKERFQN